ncbi:hypothetical protein A2U01_0107491, partial [Trifolium medium]|nr:hypothetical protein [Trifolium medium]
RAPNNSYSAAFQGEAEHAPPLYFLSFLQFKPNPPGSANPSTAACFPPFCNSCFVQK